MIFKKRLAQGVLIAGGLIGSVYTGANGAIEQYELYQCKNKGSQIASELVDRGLATNIKEQELYSICKQIKDYKTLENNHSSNARDYSILAVPFFASLLIGTLLNKGNKK
jgi:hypothetical protein